MGKKKSASLFSLVTKSFLRSGKIIPLFLLATVLCGLLISGAWGFYTAGKQVKMETAAALFGKYQVSVIDVDAKTAEKITGMDGVEESQTYFRQILQTQRGMENYIYTSDHFFELSQIQLREGRFPAKENEVLVDAGQVFRSGYENQDYIGKRIPVNGKEYLVTGIVDNLDFNVVGFQNYTYIFNQDFSPEKESYSLLLRTGNINFQWLMDRLEKDDSIPKKQVAPNEEALSYAGVNAQGVPNGIDSSIFRVVLVLLGVLSTILLYTLSVVLTKRLQHTAAIYKALGLRSRSILRAYLLLVAGAVLIGYGLSYLLAMGLVSGSFQIGFFPFLTDSANRETWLLLLTSWLLLCFTAIPSFYKALCGGNLSQKVKNSGQVKKKQARLGKNEIKNRRTLYTSLAKQNLKTTKSRTRLFITMMALCSIMFTTSSYLLSLYQETMTVKNDFDYQVDFVYSSPKDMLYGTPGHRKLFEKVKEEKKRFQVYPVYLYNTSLSLSRKDVSESYRRFLISQSTEYAAYFNNPSIKKINASAVLLGADKNTMKRLGLEGELPELKQGQCIAVNQSVGIMGSEFDMEFQVGDTLSFDCTTFEDDAPVRQELNIIKTVDTVDLNLEETRNIPLLFVDLETIQKYSAIDYPQHLFIDQPETGSPVLDYFKGEEGVQVRDLTQENALTQENFNKMRQSLNGLFAALLVFLVATMALTLFLRYRESKKQYALFRAIGVRDGHVLKIFLAEVARMNLFAALLGLAGSLLGTFLIHLYFSRSFFFFSYRIPYIGCLLPLVILFGCTLLSYLPIVWKLKRDPVMEVLREE